MGCLAAHHAAFVTPRRQRCAMILCYAKGRRLVTSGSVRHLGKFAELRLGSRITSQLVVTRRRANTGCVTTVKPVA